MRHRFRLPSLLAVWAVIAGGWLYADTAAAAPVQVVVGGTSFRNTIGERHWLDFKRQAEQRSGGELQLKMLIHGELGSEEQIVSALRRGRVQYANLSALVASTIVPETSLLYAPYLFESAAEADYVLDGYLQREFTQLLAAKGLQFIVFYDLGFQQLWSRNKPILLPTDGRGVRFRVSASTSAALFGKAMRADLIPLGFADIIPSLQTGLIEAGENGVTLYARTGTAPEAPHLTLTDHSLALSIIVADKRWWDRLAPRHRSALLESFPNAAQIRKAERAEIANDIAGAAKLRFTAYRLTPAQRAAWVRTMRPTHAALVQQIGGQSARIYAEILRQKQAFAALPGAARR